MNQSDRLPLVVEFAVNFDSHQDLLKIGEVLKNKGIELVSSSISDKTIQVRIDVENNEPGAQRRQPDSLRRHDVQSLQQYIERQTGFLAVIKGIGHLRSAVTELRPTPEVAGQQRSSCSSNELFGVVRLSQITNDVCIADGLIDVGKIDSEFWIAKRARPGRHSLVVAIHEFGDLSSDNFDSIGEPIVCVQEQELDYIGRNLSKSDTSLKISIQKTIYNCNVTETIGKSLALSLLARNDDCDKSVCNRDILSAGVIARASTIEENKKQVCTCSGKTLWQEREERQNDS